MRYIDLLNLPWGCSYFTFLHKLVNLAWVWVFLHSRIPREHVDGSIDDRLAINFFVLNLNWLLFVSDLVLSSLLICSFWSSLPLRCYRNVVVKIVPRGASPFFGGSDLRVRIFRWLVLGRRELDLLVIVRGPFWISHIVWRLFIHKVKLWEILSRACVQDLILVQGYLEAGLVLLFTDWLFPWVLLSIGPRFLYVYSPSVLVVLGLMENQGLASFNGSESFLDGLQWVLLDLLLEAIGQLSISPRASDIPI